MPPEKCAFVRAKSSMPARVRNITLHASVLTPGHRAKIGVRNVSRGPTAICPTTLSRSCPERSASNIWKKIWSVAGVLTRRRTASLATGAPVTPPEIGSLRVPDVAPEGGRRSKTIDPRVVSETVARPRGCAEATHHTKYARFALHFLCAHNSKQAAAPHAEVVPHEAARHRGPAPTLLEPFYPNS